MAVNKVDIVRFHLECDDQAFGHYFNKECGRLIDTVLPAIIDEELAPYSHADEYIHIPALEVDVEGVEETQFFDHYPQRFREALRDALAMLFREQTDTVMVRREQPSEWWEAWKAFLLTGRMPWHIASSITAMRDVFAHVLKYHAVVFKAFLMQYGHITSLQQRLVYQLEDEQIKQLVGVVHPTVREFIVRYAETLIVKYKKAPVREVSESDYRNTVWLVILAYLLTDRSSFFDKKNFLRWTIGRLAAKYNTAYSFILDQLVGDLHAFVSGSIHHPDLVLLLQELQQESQKKVDIQPQRAVLIRILSDPGSCGIYIARLSEQAIRQLVYVVVPSPSDASFVIDYADLLDKQRNTVIGHRAGGAFEKVKWRIIFPLLTVRTVTTLDQRYFVRAVIAGIAAHYNLEARQIVEWLQPFIHEFPIHKNIQLIINDWYEELQHPEAAGGNPHAGRPALFVRATLSKWKTRLADPSCRSTALEELHDTDHALLLSRLFPVHHHFVYAYAQSLGELAANKDVQLPVNATAWARVKWGFIYGVLFDTEHQVFNKKSVVRRVIQQLAAHYNIQMAALLGYLRDAVFLSVKSFAFDLVAVIVELHEEVAGKAEAGAREKGISMLQKHYGSRKQDKAWFEEMVFTPAFLVIAERLAAFETRLFEKMKLVWGNRYVRSAWLRLLAEVSQHPHSYTFHQVFSRLLAIIWSHVRTVKEGQALRNALAGLAQTEPFVAHYLKENTTPTEAEPIQAEVKDTREEASRFISNAGLVMLGPFLPRLFAASGLLDERKRTFKDRNSQIRAIFLLQHTVFGEGAFPEFEMELNKLLVGFQTGLPIPKELALAEAEKKLVNDMLSGVLHHWEKLRRSSVDALRVSFLQRSGRLFHADDTLRLHVESQSYDMLMDTLPWQFNIIRYPWMESGIYVTWR